MRTVGLHVAVADDESRIGGIDFHLFGTLDFWRWITGLRILIDGVSHHGFS
jgi:hypothetical protein